MLNNNSEIQWKSAKFSIKGFKKFLGNIKEAGIIRQRSITFGDHQQQHLHRHGETPNHYFTVDIVVKQLHETTEAFTIPNVAEAQIDDNIERNPREALERYLHDDLDQVFHYLITEAHTEIQRKAIGLRSMALEATPRLLSTRQQFAGIHSPYVYICPRRSYTGFHKEDFNLQSANLLHTGAPNVWVLIPSRQADQLEARIAGLLSLSSIKCSQFVRHQNVIIPPTLLKLWGIAFQVVLQLPGQIMITDYNVYHYVWHAGPNISEAINICGEGWLPPPMYRCCSNHRTCGGGPFISRQGMQIGEPQRLSIKPTHIPHEEIKVDSNSHADWKVGLSQRRKRKRIPSRMSKEHLDREESDLVPKSITDVYPFHAAVPEEVRYEVTDQKHPSLIAIPDSPNTTPKSPIGLSIITDPPCTDSAVQTASQIAISHLVNGTHIDEQLDALIAEGISFGSYFKLTSPEAAAMFQRFKSIKGDDIEASWLNDTALKLALEALSAHDDEIAVIDSICLDSSQWEPAWEKQPDLVLIPVFIVEHWVLVRIDVLQSIIFHHGGLDHREGAILSVAKKIDSQRKWSLQEVPNCMKNNGADCGPILLADAEIAIGKITLDDLPQESSHLRLRYLATLLTPARANIEGCNNVKKLLKRKFEDVKPVSERVHSACPFFLTKAYTTDLLAAFASPQVFADLCVLRQSADLRCVDKTKTLVAHAMALNTKSHANQMLSIWGKQYSCIILSQRYRRYTHEVQRWRDIANKRRRREFKHHEPDQPDIARSPPLHLDTYAACIMLHEWDGDHEPDVHKICQQLKDNTMSIDRDRQERINALKQLARNGHKLCDFITSFEATDPLEMPLWMLKPCSHEESQRYVDLSASERQNFWQMLREHRSQLYDSLRGLCRGLRVILGLDDDRELRIDHMNHVELLKEEPDSELLLSCLLPATSDQQGRN